MKTRIGVAAMVVAGLFGAACGSGVVSNIPQRDLPIPDTTLLTSRDDLRISPLDVVEIKVFGVDDLNGAYQVDPDGKIKFPLIGSSMRRASACSILPRASRKSCRSASCAIPR